jgi:hypothetical protein
LTRMRSGNSAGDIGKAESEGGYTPRLKLKALRPGAQPALRIG